MEENIGDQSWVFKSSLMQSRDWVGWVHEQGNRPSFPASSERWQRVGPDRWKLKVYLGAEILGSHHVEVGWWGEGQREGALTRPRASLVAQTVKRLPAMRETQVRSLGREDPWRRKWQPIPVSLPGESNGWRSLVGYSPWGRKESDTTEWLHFHFHVSP